MVLISFSKMVNLVKNGQGVGIPWVDVGEACWIRVPWDENEFGFLDKVRMLCHDLTQSSEVVLKRAGVGGCPARVDLCQGEAGLVTNSVLLCWLFLQSRIGMKMCIFHKHTIKLSVTCF